MSLRISQIAQFQLTLTPALRLSLEVLQMPLAELETYLHQQLEENPVLEMHQDQPDGALSHAPQDTVSDRVSSRLDQTVRELWQQADGSGRNGAAAPDDDDLPQRETAAPPPSLHDHLLLQLRCLSTNERLKQLGEQLLGWLDADGYLRTPLEEIAASDGTTPVELEAALSLVHRLDPAGVGARNLPECLLIQLAHRGLADDLAAIIVRDYFPLFARRKARLLATRLDVPLAEVMAACRLIAQLDPKPARNFQSSGDTTAYEVPDVIVREVNGEFVVELNDEKLPRVGLSSRYRSLLRSPGTDLDAKVFIRQRLRQAVWLLKAVQQRQSTLLSLSRALVELEKDYFRHGLSHLKALTQETLAKAISCHASTISRAIAGKSMQTPFGIMPFDAFFGGGIARPQDNGITISSRTIQAEIQRMIQAEDPAKPLSDQALQAALRGCGYPVARRTVAKYRSALKVLPAHLRKRTF